MRFQDQSFPGPKPWLFRLWACGARSACPFYEPRVLIFAWCNGLNWHSEWCRPGRSMNAITQISVIACHYDKTKHKVLNRLKRAFHRYEHRWNMRDKKTSHVSMMPRVAVGSIASCRHRMTSGIKSPCSSHRVTQVWSPTPRFKTNFTLLLVTFSDWWAEKHLLRS